MEPETRYNIIDGTAYHKNTSAQVIKLLEQYRKTGERVRLWFGENGRGWNCEYDVIGTIGRSTGTFKVPLLVCNKRSLGGHEISTDCIIRIDIKINGKIKTVYNDKSFVFDHFISTDIGNVYNETTDQLYAKCKNGDSGKRLAAFLNGERWGK